MQEGEIIPKGILETSQVTLHLEKTIYKETILGILGNSNNMNLSNLRGAEISTKRVQSLFGVHLWINLEPVLLVDSGHHRHKGLKVVGNAAIISLQMVKIGGDKVNPQPRGELTIKTQGAALLKMTLLPDQFVWGATAPTSQQNVLCTLFTGAFRVKLVAANMTPLIISIEAALDMGNKEAGKSSKTWQK